MKEAGIDAIPFADPRLDQWRENFKGVRILHDETGFELTGAVDDIWIDRNTSELIIVDYKATAKDGEVTLDADWQIGYKRQMEFYQWLMRKKGFKVSNTGYFVYCNGDRSSESFGEVIKFKVKLIPYVGDDSWIEPELFRARRCLEQAKPPRAADNCKQCSYLHNVKSLGI